MILDQKEAGSKAFKMISARMLLLSCILYYGIKYRSQSVTGDDLQRRLFSASQRCNIGTMLYLFETMLQRGVALKIVVVNRLV